MPEYTYDPGQDTGDVELSYEEKQANSISRGSASYSQRNEYVPAADDLDLINLQSQLARETNPLKREKLEARVYHLAQRSVQSTKPHQAKEIQTYDSSEVNGPQSAMNTPYGHMQQEYGRDVIEENLTWASNNLEDSTINTLNESLESEDLQTVKKAFRVIQAMRDNGITSFEQMKGGK